MRNPFWSVLHRIRHDGGLLNTLAKAVVMLRREGVRGVFARIQALRVNDYKKWIRYYDTLTDDMRADMRANVKTFARQPLISVVMPTYNSNPKWLLAAIDSIRQQIYPKWELCIADDASSDKTTRDILTKYAKNDGRIKVVMCAENGHISVASNRALELASGEWMALLDHDDLLSEHALFWVADAINQNPNTLLIYSDEDRLDEGGRRYNPYFKCDWNEDLFLTHNMISHLGVYRTDYVREIGGFRKGMEGAQDYDMALRYIERIDSGQICHIPRVLYHWREHAGSTARSARAKSYALLAGERALNEYFQRQEINANAELTQYGYRVRYSLPDILPMVSLIIHAGNELQSLRRCIGSILKKTTYSEYEILVVEDGSDDPGLQQYLSALQAEPRVRLVRITQMPDYSSMQNNAVKQAQGQLVGLMNDHLEVISSGWLSEMVSIALQPKVGAVGAKLLYPNNTLQHGGIILGIGGYAGYAHKHLEGHRPGYAARAVHTQSLSAVTGACLVVKKDAYENIGGFNEKELRNVCGDIDFCLRLTSAGYRNVWTPYAELYNYEATSCVYEQNIARKRFLDEIHYMQQKWGDLLMNDPAYSPNLTLDREDFSYAWPPRVPSI